MLIQEGPRDASAMLVVDNEPLVLMEICALLAREYRVYGTDDLSAAAEIMKNEAITLVIADMWHFLVHGADLLSTYSGSGRPVSFRVTSTCSPHVESAFTDDENHRTFCCVPKPWDVPGVVEILRGLATLAAESADGAGTATPRKRLVPDQLHKRSVDGRPREA